MFDVEGQRVLVMGLGRSGRSAAAFLAERGARVVAADERPADALDPLGNLAGRVELVAGRPFPDPADFDWVMPSPGVPAERWRGRAHRALGDVELAWRALSVPVVAVTGTNGKTTTVLLIERMLCAAGLRAEAGGNLGRPALELVGRPLDAAVLEVSSFQLEAVETFRPRVGVVLNLTPDHLDRHGSFEAYAAAKARLFERQRDDDTAIASGDNPAAAALLAASGGRRWSFRTGGPVSEGAWWDAGAPVLQVDGERVRLPEPPPGTGVAPESLLAALLACRALGADPGKAMRGLVGFEMPAHRREVVARHAGITWINDSKATNPAAALYALNALETPAVWIAGGRGKGVDLAALATVAAARVHTAILIGEAADALDAALGERVRTLRAAHLEEAVALAAAVAEPGHTVLLSPACASFDQFRNFEERGDRFRDAVQRRLPAAANGDRS